MFRRALAACLPLLLAGCANLGYYAQAVGGHLQIMQAARPVEQIVADPETDPKLRTQLEQASAIRDFASRELGLPDNGSYRKYADLGRPYVVWNVFAAKEFSVELEHWCPLFVGCVAYRGYYDHAAALREAEALRQQGLETYVGNVPAYSTLGYFDDPLLNTFLRFGEQEVARVIFHELAHQRVYVADDSTFNESFATAVENEAMRRWLLHQGSAAQLQSFQRQQERKAQFRQLIADYRGRLADLYTRPWPPDEMRQAKTALIAALKQAYAGRKADWGGAFDAFFAQRLDNASLGSVSLYYGLVPAFEALLDESGHNLPRFYQQAEALSRLGKAERDAALAQIAAHGLSPRRAAAVVNPPPRP